MRKGRVEDWEGLKWVESEQEKRRGKGKRRRDGKRGEERDFQKFEILTANTPLQCQLASPCQVSCRSVKPFHT